jgi:regulator of sirC expression with transglutaminase-like and TPR domain
MDQTTLLSMALVALAVAIIVTAIEMRLSLAPVACPECLHCRARAAAEAARQRELDQAYASLHGLDGDEDDERRIG